MNKCCRLNPTNGVGGFFIRSLQGEAVSPPLFISRARLAAREAGARDERRARVRPVRASRQSLNDPPTPLVGFTYFALAAAASIARRVYT